MIPRLSVLLIACLAFAVPAAAEQGYSAWSNPDASSAQGTDRLQDMVDRLNALIDKAEKARAADPVFLRDLRDLTRGFNRPWRSRLLFDDFQDGDFTANPAWTLTAGRFWIESGWGLRSSVDPSSPQAASNSGQDKLSGRDAAIAILGQILNQAAGQGSGGLRTGEDTPPAFSAIDTSLLITNAFAIEMAFSSWQERGRLELDIYQGASRSSGYQLAYSPGEQLELLLVSSRGIRVIDRTTQPLILEDQKPHRIEWTRHPDGAMKVSVDGKEHIAVTDRSFRDPFNGFRITNRGGDYIVRQVAIFGTP